MEYECYMHFYQKCNSKGGDDQSDDFHKVYCKYDDNDEMDKSTSMRRIIKVGCDEFKTLDNVNRFLGGQNDNDETKYHVGSYCANQEGRIYS